MIASWILLTLIGAVQDEDARTLIQGLGSANFEEQGRAAAALDRLGETALPELKKAAQGSNPQIKEWASRIADRIERRLQAARAEREQALRRFVASQVAFLGGEDFVSQGKAAEELRKKGPEILPILRETLQKTTEAQVRTWLTRVIESLGGSVPVLPPPPPLPAPVDLPAAGGAMWKSLFPSRGAQKAQLAIRGGGGGDTEAALLSALKWLARHQSPNGAWRVTGYLEECRKHPRYVNSPNCSPNPGHEDFDAGVTGLALLAFLGAGYGPLSKDVHDEITFGEVVQKGLAWLISQQDAEGCVGNRNLQKYLYNHFIGANALAEAYGLSGLPAHKEAALLAFRFTLAAQNPGKGWRYSFKSGDSDSSVTGWAVMSLKGGEMVGFSPPKVAYDGARAWFEDATEIASARTGYTHKGTGKVFIPGMNEQFDHHEAMSAIGILTRIVAEKSRVDARNSMASDLLMRDKPRWDGNSIDFYYWYYASMALFQYDGPAGPKWRAWNGDLRSALVKSQNDAGCKAGSWDPIDRWSGEGGRVYGTALNALTLETYYRYPVLPAK